MTTTRFYRFITIALLAFGTVSCASKAESETVSPLLSASFISDTLAKSDALFKERADAAKLREAVKTLSAARNADQRNFEIEWKFAQYNYFLGKQATDEKEKKKAFEDGAAAGKIASRMEANKPEGYFWYAVNLGEQAKMSPVTIGIKSVDDIKEAMNKVIEIQPEYQTASAYVALAQVELNTAVMFGGKPEKAVEYLEKALTISKENSFTYLHLAEAYLATGRKEEAKKQLDILLKMKPNPDYLPEHNENVAKAKKLLETKF